MTIKQLFDKVIEDPNLREELDLSSDKIKDLDINSRFNDDYVVILKEILHGIENKTPRTSLYKIIRKHYNISP